MTKKEIEIKQQRIIKNIKLLAKELGRTPTRDEYCKKFGNPQFKNIGGFSVMLEKAGFIKNKHNNLSNDEIKNLYIKYIKKNGVPKSKGIPKELPSYNLVCYRFESYKKFLNSLGYNTLEKSYTKDEIIKLLQDGIDNGDIKSIMDLSKKDYPVPVTIYKILGVNSWKETLNLINRKLQSNYSSNSRYNFTKEELKDMYFELSEKLNKTNNGASQQDVKKHLGMTQDVFQRVFKKSFIELKKEWGFEVINRRNCYTKEIIAELLKNKIKEKGKELTTREIIIDEDLPTLSTIYRIFNTKSIKEIYKMIK